MINAKRPAVRDDDEQRVVPFRPRSADARSLTPAPSGDAASPTANPPHELAQDLSRYEAVPEQPDDFRRRMLANAAALAFTLALLAVGIWLAKSIAELRNTQDCLLMGRRDCAPISTTK